LLIQFTVRNKSKLFRESHFQTVALSGLVDDDVARPAQVSGDDLLEQTVSTRHPDLVETVVSPVEIVSQPVNCNTCRATTQVTDAMPIQKVV